MFPFTVQTYTSGFANVTVSKDHVYWWYYLSQLCIFKHTEHDYYHWYYHRHHHRLPCLRLPSRVVYKPRQICICYPPSSFLPTTAARSTLSSLLYKSSLLRLYSSCTHQSPRCLAVEENESRLSTRKVRERDLAVR